MNWPLSQHSPSAKPDLTHAVVLMVPHFCVFLQLSYIGVSLLLHNLDLLFTDGSSCPLFGSHLVLHHVHHLQVFYHIQVFYHLQVFYHTFKQPIMTAYLWPEDNLWWATNACLQKIRCVMYPRALCHCLLLWLNMLNTEGHTPICIYPFFGFLSSHSVTRPLTDARQKSAESVRQISNIIQ